MRKFILFMLTLVATVTMSAQHVVQSNPFDNTYVSVSVGGTVQTDLFKGVDDFDKVRPVIGVEFGKDLTTLYGMSIEGKGTFNNKGVHTIFDDFSVVWNHKFNLTNAICGYKVDRAWELKTVGGIGWGHDNGCVASNYLVGEAGLELDYNINEKWAFNINPTFVWNHAEHGLNVNHSEMELSVGFTYKFPKRGFELCNVSEVMIERDLLNDKVNEMRVSLENKDAEIDAQKNLLAEKDKTINELNARKMVTNVTLPSVIGFELGKSKILPTNQGSLITLAKFLNENKDLKVNVVGHADAKTGTAEINQKLSEARANAVKDALVKAGVSEDRITAIGKGDTEQLFEENDANRAVITLFQ